MPDRNDSSNDAQPYRTPANVSETTAGRGAMKSPLVWFAVLATTAAVAFGSYFLMSPVRDFNATRRPVQKISDHVEDFGLYRYAVEDGAPVEDLEIVGDVLTIAESPSPDGG